MAAPANEFELFPVWGHCDQSCHAILTCGSSGTCVSVSYGESQEVEFHVVRSENLPQAAAAFPMGGTARTCVLMPPHRCPGLALPLVLTAVLQRFWTWRECCVAKKDQRMGPGPFFPSALGLRFFPSALCSLGAPFIFPWEVPDFL